MSDTTELLQGTLDLLILKAVSLGPLHGYGVFAELGRIKDTLDPRSVTIATFALCGFANFASIGMQIGGISALAPTRRGDLARLGMRAMLAGTLANFVTAIIVGFLL